MSDQLILNGTRFYYDRQKSGRGTYGTFDLPYSSKRQDKPQLYATLGNWLGDMRDIGLPVEAVATAGTWVPKGGAHEKGIAVDIDCIRLEDGRILNTRQDHREPTELYMRVDACLRFHFGVVLDWAFDHDTRRAHADHFHCDLSHSSKFTAVKASSGFVQWSLLALGFDPSGIDRDVGPKTKAAFQSWYEGLGKPSPHDYLTLPFMARALATHWRELKGGSVAEPDPPAQPTEFDLAKAWALEYNISDCVGLNDTERRVLVWHYRAWKLVVKK